MERKGDEKRSHKEERRQNMAIPVLLLSFTLSVQVVAMPRLGIPAQQKETTPTTHATGGLGVQLPDSLETKPPPDQMPTERVIDATNNGDSAKETNDKGTYPQTTDSSLSLTSLKKSHMDILLPPVRERSESPNRSPIKTFLQTLPTDSSWYISDTQERVEITEPSVPGTVNVVICENVSMKCHNQSTQVKCFLARSKQTKVVKWAPPFLPDCPNSMVSLEIDIPEQYGVALKIGALSYVNLWSPADCQRFPGERWLLWPDGATLNMVAFNRTRSSVTFVYIMHPLSMLPRKLPSIGCYRLRSYNCSHLRTVPQFLRCDMVEHCADNKDEPPDCEYRRTYGCDIGWIPYGENCLKLETIETPADSWPPPDIQCASKYEARLAPLPQRNERQLVYKFFKLYGFVTDYIELGLKKYEPKWEPVANLYRHLWKWGNRESPVAYQQLVFASSFQPEHCARLTVSGDFTYGPCVNKFQKNYVCLKPNNIYKRPTSQGLHLKPAKTPLTQIRSKVCADGSLVHEFSLCEEDLYTEYDGRRLFDFPLFPCNFGSVHYTLVCDARRDCVSGEDEENCLSADLSSVSAAAHVTCAGPQRYQIIPASSLCNGVIDCFDKSDEADCLFCPAEFILCPSVGCVPLRFRSWYKPCDMNGTTQTDMDPPAILQMDGFGMAHLVLIVENESCPETHYQCPDGYCIPTYLLNNHEQDCLGGEDEKIPKLSFTCPGYYRCVATGSCLHPDFVCDGVHHCPHKDDEMYCKMKCPDDCICEGYAFRCWKMFDPMLYISVRYLDLSGSRKPSLAGFRDMPFLRFLNLSQCDLDTISLSSMPLLNILDLSFNRIHNLDSLQLENLTGLTSLHLSGNPVTPHLGSDFNLFSQEAGLGNLKTLIITDAGLVAMASGAFQHTKHLLTLDLRNNPLKTFAKDSFDSLKRLRVLRVDDPRLCCDYFHENTMMTTCDAPKDELSSCDDLLKSEFFRAFLWIFSVLAITGNTGVLIYRLFFETEGTSFGHKVLVTNLSLSDFLMGVYLMVIGTADAQFRGLYVSKAGQWKESSTCMTAGVLALVSSEVSAFAICLITLDRLLVIRYPFNSRLRLSTKRNALTICGATWAVGLTLATLPLFQITWEFYGQNGICLPLPITQRPFAGQQYAFGVFVILNFLIFLVIGAGQALILHSICSSAKATMRDDHKREITVARRLFLIVFTDFCCWFPVGLMGLLVLGGVPIPGVVNVLAAVFVLPLNSAVNPFLYTLNTLLERRAKRRMNERIERLMGKLRAELRTWPRDKVEEHVHYCLTARLVPRQRMLQALGVGVDLYSNKDHWPGQPETVVSRTTSATRMME